jgi:hypothetical protein
MAHNPRLYFLAIRSVHYCTDAALRIALASSAFSNSYRRMSPKGWTEGSLSEDSRSAAHPSRPLLGRLKQWREGFRSASRFFSMLFRRSEIRSLSFSRLWESRQSDLRQPSGRERPCRQRAIKMNDNSWRRTHGDFCSGSVRVRPLPPSR